MMGYPEKRRYTPVALAVLNVLNYSLIILLQAVIAYTFGARAELDAYYVGFILPQSIITWILMGTSSFVLVPILSEYVHSGEPEKARKVGSTFVTLGFLITLFVTLIAEIFSPKIISVIAPGLHGENYRLAVNMNRLLFLVLLASSIGWLIRGILYAYKKLILPSVASCVLPLLTILIFLLFVSQMGIYALVLGSIVGAFCFTVVQFPALRGTGYHYSASLRDQTKTFRRIGHLLIPFLIIGFMAQIQALADRFFASLLPEGNLSILVYARKFEVPLIGILPAAISLPVFTLMAEYKASNRFMEIRQTLVKGIRWIALSTLPFLTTLLVLSVPVVRLFYERGEFTHIETERVAEVLMFYLPAFLAFSFSFLLMQSFFALQKVKFLTLVAILQMIFLVALEFLFYKPFGVRGIALATSIATFVSNVILWIALRRRMRGLNFPNPLLFFLKLAIALVLFGLVLHGTYALLAPLQVKAGFLKQLFSLGGAMLVALGIYLLTLHIFRVREIQKIGDALFSFWNNLVKAR